MKKGTLLEDYKGERYTVFCQGNHSETDENMIVYQNNKTKMIMISPLYVFDEEVEYKGKMVSRFEEIQFGSHGGIPTIMKDLSVGTKFYVCNGDWLGEIILKEGEKHILFKGDDIRNAQRILDESTLDIEIIN